MARIACSLEQSRLLLSEGLAMMKVPCMNWQGLTRYLSKMIHGKNYVMVLATFLYMPVHVIVKGELS